MIGDLARSLGTLVGTAVAAVERRLPSTEDGPLTSDTSDTSKPSAPGEAAVAAEDAGGRAASDTESPLVDSVLAAVVGLGLGALLRPRRVSWPRVVVSGIGATVLADAVARASGPPSVERDRAYSEDPDALLVRLGSGVALAAGYASLLYTRLPGSPLAKGLILGAMEIAAAPHGGLVRIATDAPGLRFPLKDLAIPLDDDAGPLANLAFGVTLGLLYRPAIDDE